MATFTKTDAIAVANKRVKIGTLTLGTYATGGETIAPSLFGLRKITALTVCGPFRKSDDTDAVFGSYNHTSGKMAVYRQKDPANAGGADIPAPEVANALSLASYGAHVVVWGY